MDSLPRQNFHLNSEAAINKQINMELYASYVYQAMSFNFMRDDISLPGCVSFFAKRSKEELAHAEAFMKYQNLRGGRIALQAIAAPEITEWQTALSAMECSLKLEKTVNSSLLDLHAIASKHNDSQLTDFIEGNYLKEQVDDIKELADLITMAKRCGPGLGEFSFDQSLN